MVRFRVGLGVNSEGRKAKDVENHCRATHEREYLRFRSLTGFRNFVPGLGQPRSQAPWQRVGPELVERPWERGPYTLFPVLLVRRNCAEHFKAGNTNSGVYSIDPDGAGAFDVFCDQVTDGGGWTVFQKRIDGSVDFYRGWNDYKIGFGDPAGEYWLGNDKINRLTRQGTNKLRVDLEDTTGQKAHAEYSLFAVSSESTKYQLSLGAYSG